jgi:serine/threonine protein kinase
MSGGAPRPGSVLAGRYQLLEVMGEGGMAEVWRAFDQRLQRPVAVKLISERFASDPEFQRRFEREARHVASLSHPGIVAVHDYGVDTERAFIVMELVDGESLRQVLDRSGQLPIARVSAFAVPLLDALQHAHDRGLVHRDLKPANILIAADGSAKIADFGIARMGSGDTEITLPGLIVGTAVYAAPEQFGDGPIGPATDIYSFGVVLYECVTGRAPFHDDDAARLILRQRFAEPDPIDTDRTSVPDAMAAAIMCALEKIPSRRFASATSMAQCLATSGEAGSARGPTADLGSEDRNRSEAAFDAQHTLAFPESAADENSTDHRSEDSRATRGAWNRRTVVMVAIAVVLGVGGIISGMELTSPGTRSGLNGGDSREASGNGEMLPGALLDPGRSILSRNGRFGLAMQPDGNLLTYVVSGHVPTWESSTQGSRGAYADMQSDGDFVVYPKGASPPAPGHTTTALWSSGSTGHPGATLRLLNDGNLVVSGDRSNITLWTTGAVPGSLGSELLPGMELHPDQYLQSPNGRYRLVNESKQGVLRLFMVGRTGCTLWQEPNHGTAVSYAEMQQNGNLAMLHNRTNAVEWQTNVGTHPGASLVLESSGVLLLSSANGVTLWQVSSPVTPNGKDACPR